MRLLLRTYATRLMLVVLCLEASEDSTDPLAHHVLCLRQLTDVIFAVCDLSMLAPLLRFSFHHNLEPLEVDSISAIVAQIPDLFLVPAQAALGKRGVGRAFFSTSLAECLSPIP